MTHLVVIEGIDGAGTTTQTRRLVEHLHACGRTAHATREPSDGPIGRLIRELLLRQHAPADQVIRQSTFGPLFAADRLDHLQREVEPQLCAGAIVISDRWYHSSLAYQGTEADREWIVSLNARARQPDLTIFLEVDPEIAAQRRIAAGRRPELFEDLEMQRAVAAGCHSAFVALRARGERIEVIDGERPRDDVSAQILSLVGALLT